MAMPIPSMTGGAGGASGPATATNSGGGYGGIFDASGWTVSTGSSKASSTPFTLSMPLLIGAALLGLYLWKKR